MPERSFDFKRDWWILLVVLLVVALLVRFPPISRMLLLIMRPGTGPDDVLLFLFLAILILAVLIARGTITVHAFWTAKQRELAQKRKLEKQARASLSKVLMLILDWPTRLEAARLRVLNVEDGAMNSRLTSQLQEAARIFDAAELSHGQLQRDFGSPSAWDELPLERLQELSREYAEVLAKMEAATELLHEVGTQAEHWVEAANS